MRGDREYLSIWETKSQIWNWKILKMEVEVSLANLNKEIWN